MKPLRVYLKNFMNHRKTEIDCTNFQTVLIVGRNQKNERISNGVGKTTIFRAIEYALFNQSHATTLDKVVRDGKKKAVVEFDFELNREVYRIYRHRTSTGSADVRLYKLVGSNFESISGRTPSVTDALIRELIKISHKAFTYSVLFRQADLTGITSVTDPKKRKEILKEPLNLATYTKLEEMAVEKRRPVKRKIDNLEGSIQVIGNPDEDIKKATRECAITQAKIKLHQEAIEANEKSIQQKRQTVEDLKQSLGQQDIDIHKRVSEQEVALKKLKEDAKSSETRLTKITKLISDKELELKTSEQSAEQIQDRLGTLLQNNSQNLEELQAIYDKICSDEVKGSELIAAIKAQMKITKKTLPDDDECPTCHQSITAEYRRSMVEDVKKKLAKQQKDLEDLEDNMSKCRRKKARADEKLKAEQTRRTEVEKLETRAESLGKEQKSLRAEIDRAYTDQKETSKSLRDAEQEITEVTQHLKTLKEAANKSDAPALNNKTSFKMKLPSITGEFLAKAVYREVWKRESRFARGIKTDSR